MPSSVTDSPQQANPTITLGNKDLTTQLTDPISPILVSQPLRQSINVGASTSTSDPDLDSQSTIESISYTKGPV